MQDPDGLSRACTVHECGSKLPDASAAMEVVNKHAERASEVSVESIVDKWHYVKPEEA